MRLLAAAIALLLLATLPRAAAAQGVGSIHRLQQMVGTLHLRQLLPDASTRRQASSPTPILTVDRQIFRSTLLSTLRHQVRLPLNPRADLTLVGRIGALGPSTQVRVRLRF